MKLRLATLLLLTLVAGWFRFENISFGLPDTFRPDEEYLVSRAMGFETDFNPHFTVYPALQMYVQHAALRTSAWLSDSDRDFRSYIREKGVAGAHLSGRSVSAALGTLTVPAIYWAAIPVYGPVAALTSAAALSVATIHVRESKYATTDAAATFWLTLALGAMLRVVSDGRIRWSILSGILTGLAIGTKYPAGAVLAGIAVAHVGARWREGRTLWRVFRDLRPWLALYMTILVFILASPYVFLDWAETLKGFEYQSGFVLHGVGNTHAGWGWSWFIENVLPDSFGPELASVLVIATLWVALRPRIGTLSLLSFLAVALVGLTSSRYSFYRYVMVPLPALFLFLGIAVSDVQKFASRRMPSRAATLGVAIFVILLLVPSVIRDYKINRHFGRRDTRTIARLWIEENIPRGDRIAATNHQTPYGKPQVAGRNSYVSLDMPSELRARGVRWILSDSGVLPFYSPGPSVTQEEMLASQALLRLDINPIKPGTPKPVFDEADAFYVPLRHGSSVKRPGPRLRIWELRNRPAPLATANGDR